MTNTKLLRGYIVMAGLTVGEVAEKLNLSRSGFSAKLNGRSEFTISEVVTLSKLLNIQDKDSVFFCTEVDKWEPTIPTRKIF